MKDEHAGARGPGSKTQPLASCPFPVELVLSQVKAGPRAGGPGLLPGEFSSPPGKDRRFYSESQVSRPCCPLIQAVRHHAVPRVRVGVALPQHGPGSVQSKPPSPSEGRRAGQRATAGAQTLCTSPARNESPAPGVICPSCPKRDSLQLER